MAGRLSGKVVIVTGATRGIGSGIARAAAGEGAQVVLAGRDETAGRALAAQIGDAAVFVRTDVSVAADCRALVAACVARHGRVDGLVNNAGIFPRGTLLNTEETVLDTVLAVNLKGAFYCSRCAVEAMMRGGGGSVVNIGSTHAWAGAPDLAAYAVSKGALHTLTQHIARNYARRRIRANWVTVGWVETPGEEARLAREGKGPEWLREEVLRRVPLGRLQTEEDVASAVVFLLSDEAAQVTGTDIQVTGGFLP